jgi:hypothetical protein
MSTASATAVLLAIAALAAMWRSARIFRTGSPLKAGPVSRGWRQPNVWAQPILAALFYLLLFPLHTSQRGDALTVLTPGTTAAQLRDLPRAQRVVVLPDAPAPANAALVPDLATALRVSPAVKNVSIVGGGLPLRDQEAASGLASSFDAAPLRGIVELLAPAHTLLGSLWTASGRVTTPATTIELRDPSGAVVDRTAVDGTGHFRLSAQARAPGQARFELRAIDERRDVVDTVSVPIVAKPGDALSIIVRAGAPDPELKYFRHWAAEAGIGVRFTAGLSEGVAVHEGDARLTPEALAAADLVIVDERGWLALDDGEKTALRAAVDDGLGLLLRVAGPVDDRVGAEWRDYAYTVTTAAAPASVTLDARLASRERVAFTMAPVAVAAGTSGPDATDRAAPMLTADDGRTLAWWRGEGRGRVGLWCLTDSYRLVLLGEAARYGTLWSESIATLARARPAPREPRLPAQAWTDERAVLCDLGGAASAVGPDDVAVELVADANGCAGWWPAASGWYRLRTGGEEWPVYVRAADDAAGLRMARDQRATQRLLRREATASSGAPGSEAPMSRWPFFCAWLLVAAAVWWRERQVTAAR